jgi:hypothetical protein
MIRPENILLQKALPDDCLSGRIKVISYQGATAHIILSLEGGEALSVECNGRLASEFRLGDKASATIDEASITVFT